MDIGVIVAEAFQQAVSEKSASDTASDIARRVVHREWSQHFVLCLADRLRRSFNSARTAVMSKDLLRDQPEVRNRIRKQFGMYELMFDVVAFKYEEISASNGESLAYASKCLWIVESEMAKDSRQALYDFNKLTLGSSENKLFIGPIVAHEKRSAYLASLGAAARHCEGHLYLALIPHPGDWHTSPLDPIELLTWTGEGWRDVPRASAG